MNERGRWALLLLSLLVGGGCQVALERPFVSLPELTTDIQSLVLILDEPAPRGVRTVASTRDGPLDVLVQSGATLYLLGYSEPMDALGFEAGPVAASTCRRFCSRLTPTRVWSARWSADDPTWTEIAMPELAVAQLIEMPEQSCGRCRRYVQSVVEDTLRTAFVEEWGDEAIGATLSGDVFIIGVDGRARQQCAVPPTVRAGVVKDDRLILSFEDGLIADVEVTDAGACGVRPIGRVTGEPFRVAVTDDAARVIYALTSTTSFVELWRLDTDSSNMLSRFALDPGFVPEVRRGYWGDIVFLGPDHLAFVIGDQDIYELDQGNLRSRRVLGQRAFAAQSMTVVDGRPYVGGHPWGLARYDGTEWRLLSESDFWSDIAALLPVDDTILLAAKGALGFYDVVDERYCDPFDVVPNNQLVRAVRLGSDGIVMAEQPVFPESTVRLLKPEAGACE